MKCHRCLALDCKVMDRFAAYRLDPYALQPLQNAMLACAIASSYTNKGARSTVTESMLRGAHDQ